MWWNIVPLMLNVVFRCQYAYKYQQINDRFVFNRVKRCWSNWFQHFRYDCIASTIYYFRDQIRIVQFVNYATLGYGTVEDWKCNKAWNDSNTTIISSMTYFIVFIEINMCIRVLPYKRRSTCPLRCDGATEEESNE